ncbi:DUF4411 family protein [Thiohalobacter thiocyanaticus]|uniref:DUF4411 family protein n=1 Tax=Thiohalobacter thiocyanaticus TaxID=585455 RepID=A0A426QJJ7_9GAMM|nr:DUF4411 family protein [Thiohalobacter thiocyanaticus]RRQ21910.1 DUF4411 family protein [Thiohalobacter thiocyanaticus]
MDFSFDTSAFIEPAVRLYPRDLFEPHWVWVEKLINDGQIRCTELVRDELQASEDELYKWAMHQSELFVPIDEAIQTAVTDVIKHFPTLTDYHRDRSGADPWVIALSLANGKCPVVTYEKMGKNSAPRIPNACVYFGIECFTWVDVFRATKFS